ncbi:hypothetical protein DFH29DRAFT_894194, partial [Suillus ampliporus]
MHSGSSYHYPPTPMTSKLKLLPTIDYDVFLILKLPSIFGVTATVAFCISHRSRFHRWRPVTQFLNHVKFSGYSWSSNAAETTWWEGILDLCSTFPVVQFSHSLVECGSILLLSWRDTCVVPGLCGATRVVRSRPKEQEVSTKVTVRVRFTKRKLALAPSERGREVLRLSLSAGSQLIFGGPAPGYLSG